MSETETEGMAVLNTDRELWREPTDEVGMEYYQPSIHVTERGGIGIDVGGLVIVKTLRQWHELAAVDVRQQIEAARHAGALQAEAEALVALKEVCRDVISSTCDDDTLARLSDALDRYWTAGSTLEPIDPDEHTRRAVAEAIDWDRAFNRHPNN